MTKKVAAAALLIAGFALIAGSAQADRYRRGTNDNPFRLISYPVHAAGIIVEYTLMRPIHWVVSQPYLDIVFGHKSMPYDDTTYFEFTHGDFSPTISRERQLGERAQRLNRR